VKTRDLGHYGAGSGAVVAVLEKAAAFRSVFLRGNALEHRQLSGSFGIAMLESAWWLPENMNSEFRIQN
jgi:hypothetical protein